METIKAAWSKPELVVLARTKTQEFVLAACKTTGGGVAGPAAGNCSKPAPGCFDLAAS